MITTSLVPLAFGLSTIAFSLVPNNSAACEPLPDDIAQSAQQSAALTGEAGQSTAIATDDVILTPGLQSVFERFVSIIVDSDLNSQHDHAVITAVSELTKNITPEGVAAVADVIRTSAGIPDSDDSLGFLIDDSTPGVGWTLAGETVIVEDLSLHDSNASMWTLCAEMPETCQLVQAVDALFPGLVHGTYSATLNEMVTVGLFGQVATDAGVFTVIMPYYIAPDSAVITGYQYAEFFLQFKDGLFPQDMGYLFGPETDLSFGPVLPDECVPQEVNDCITLILHTLKADLREREAFRNEGYNSLLEDAQEAARKCSPAHSLEGLMYFFFPGGSSTATRKACDIWKDFDEDVQGIDDWLHDDVCDMNKKAKKDIMDCLEDCPQWMKDVFEARCDEAILALGCD